MASTTSAPRSDDNHSSYNCSPISPEDQAPLLADLGSQHSYEFEFQDATPHHSINASDDGGEKCSIRSGISEEKRKGGPFFGVRHSDRRSRKAKDPFDYEHQYDEDEPYQEMGEKARMWKTYLAESAKVDADKVANWTDALDVLLVFAGLFSAVVSTFVSQTFQTLQIDNSEVTSYLVFELVHLQRASMDGHPSSSVPPSPLTPNMTFRPTSTASWINGLWFTSLALSLTTALIAVLTKQWIHEYRTSIELGTYRERGRIRQFRFTNLSEWHVPVIIGLLPVLMHVSLGIFFAGLILLLLSLSRRIASSISVVVAAALAAYLVTNVLPVFNPACPYKTPLTHYAYRVVHLIRNAASPKLRQRFARSLRCWASSTRTLPNTLVSQSLTNAAAPADNTLVVSSSFGSPSLVEAEKAMVRQITYIIDAQAVVWLYGVSSNSSVQTIVLQAIGNLPLRSIPLVTCSIPECVIVSAIEGVLNSSEMQHAVAQPAYERLERSLIRVSPQKSLSWPPTDMRSPGSLPRLLNFCESEQAAQFLAGEILVPSVKHDVAVWVQILKNALRAGPEWLGMEDESPVWRTFLSWFFAEPHMCLHCAKRDGSAGNVYSCMVHNYATMHRTNIGYGARLSVLDNPLNDVSTTKPLHFKEATLMFLLPSLSSFLLDTVYRDWCMEDVYIGLPSDVRLRHVLIQLPSIQATGFSSDFRRESPIATLITSFETSVGTDGWGSLHIHHNSILPATFQTLTSIVSHIFPGDAIPPAERQRLLHPLFRALLLDTEGHRGSDTRLAEGYHSWMTDAVAEDVLRFAFMESSDLAEQSPLLFDLVECAVRMKCHKMVPAVYSQLCSSNWLQVIGASRFGQTASNTPVEVEQTSYGFLAAAFIEGLKVLRQLAPLIYLQALNYVRTPSNLLIITKLLIFSDVERRRSLQTLAPLITLDLWRPCLHELGRFLQQQEVAAGYACQRSYLRHLYLEEPLHYEPYEKVVNALSDFTRDIHKHSGSSIPTVKRPRNKIYSLLCCGPRPSLSDDHGVHDEHELAWLECL